MSRIGLKLVVLELDINIRGCSDKISYQYHAVSALIALILISNSLSWQCLESAKLLGVFVSPEVYLKLLLPHVKDSTSCSSASPWAPLMVLGSVLRGSTREALGPHLIEIGDTLAHPEVCQGSQQVRDSELSECSLSILKKCSLSDLPRQRPEFNYFQSDLPILVVLPGIHYIFGKVMQPTNNIMASNSRKDYHNQQHSHLVTFYGPNFSKMICYTLLKTTICTLIG